MRIHRRVRLAALVAPLLLAPPTMLEAQRGLSASGGPTAAQLRVQSTLPGVNEALSAAAFGFDAGLRIGRLGLALTYLQSNLTGTTPGALSRRAAEGELMVYLTAARWLCFMAGPEIRSYRTDVGTQRWLAWEIRARVETAMLPGIARGYLTVWPVVAASIRNVPEPFASGFGGEAGLTLSPPRLPIWVRLGYRLELFRLDGGARRELIDGVRVSAGIATR
ncbi:MAG: hypothetical protein HY560_11440 [Gemmatimonadetes bacterium]|nr:hypothetical protein [Gemmatimonadota bacterium]